MHVARARSAPPVAVAPVALALLLASCAGRPHPAIATPAPVAPDAAHHPAERTMAEGAPPMRPSSGMTMQAAGPMPPTEGSRASEVTFDAEKTQVPPVRAPRDLATLLGGPPIAGSSARCAAVSGSSLVGLFVTAEAMTVECVEAMARGAVGGPEAMPMLAGLAIAKRLAALRATGLAKGAVLAERELEDRTFNARGLVGIGAALVQLEAGQAGLAIAGMTTPATASSHALVARSLERLGRGLRLAALEGVVDDARCRSAFDAIVARGTVRDLAAAGIVFLEEVPLARRPSAIEARLAHLSSWRAQELWYAQAGEWSPGQSTMPTTTAALLRTGTIDDAFFSYFSEDAPDLLPLEARLRVLQAARILTPKAMAAPMWSLSRWDGHTAKGPRPPMRALLDETLLAIRAVTWCRVNTDGLDALANDPASPVAGFASLNAAIMRALLPMGCEAQPGTADADVRARLDQATARGVSPALQALIARGP